ncbi:MAG: TetR/AcrR family transcriptional regulator [Clostridia bacterium]|nr:TetR/AcrR family transcriptional regulator [Clostridia bacterium]
MAPKRKITKEDIISGALELAKTDPERAWKARGLAAHLGISTQPIFTHFSGMEEVKECVLKRAYALFEKRMQEEIEKGKYPVYKASGMAYVSFAREEPALFRLLYMRSRRGENTEGDRLTEGLWGVVESQTGIGGDKAKLFHLEMWSCVHGIATMLATGFLDLNEEAISLILTDLYQGLVKNEKEAVQ